MTDCPPGAFCPDHPSIPFAAALTALPLLSVTALTRRIRRSRPVPQETAAHIIAAARHIDTCLREAGHLPPAVTEGTQL